jgi:hypothetical protein
LRFLNHKAKRIDILVVIVAASQGNKWSMAASKGKVITPENSLRSSHIHEDTFCSEHQIPIKLEIDRNDPVTEI